MSTLPPITLSGPKPAVQAVTSILQDVAPLPESIRWTLREREGDVEIREAGRITVASSWDRCVRLHMFPRVGAVVVAE